MRRAAWWGLGVAGLLLLSAGVAVKVATSDWLRQKIRARVVAEVERSTGGRASLDGLAFDWKQSVVRVRGFRLRGTEAADRAPFVQIPSLQLGLTVHSWLRRDVELGSLEMKGAAVHIYVDADGRTNLPTPKVPRTGSNPVADLIRLRIGRLAISDALFEYDSRKIPFATLAEAIDLHLTYDRTRPRYQAEVTAQRVHLPGGVAPALEARAGLQAGGMQVDQLKLRLGESTAEFHGRLEDWRQPRASGDFRAAIQLRDVPGSPIRQGFGSATGKLTFDLEKGFELSGTGRAEQLGWRNREFRIDRVGAGATFRLGMHRLELDNLAVTSPLGRWRGRGRLSDWRAFQLDGDASGLSLGALEEHFAQTHYAWDGAAEGPLSLSGEVGRFGVRGVKGSAHLSIEPAPGALPVEGRVELSFDVDSRRLEVGSSYFATPSFHADLRGTLGQRLEVGLSSTELRDVEHVAAILLRRESFHLPISLRGGEARLKATIEGPLEKAEISGAVSFSAVAWRDILFDQAQAGFHLNRSRLYLDRVSLGHQRMRAGGELRLGLADWQPGDASALEANVKLTGGDLERLLRLLGLDTPAGGSLQGTLRALGTLGAPHGELELSLADAAWRKERWKAIHARLALDASGRVQGTAEVEGARLELTGVARHPHGDFTRGALEARLRASSVQLESFETLAAARPGLRGELAGELAFHVTLEDGQAHLHSLDGTLSAPEIQLGARRLGAFKAAGATLGQTLDATFSLAIPSGALEGDAHVELQGDYPAKGTLRLPRLPFALLQDVASTELDASRHAAWPVRGFLQGAASWRAPLADLDKATAEVTVSGLQLRPRDTQTLETQVDTGELTLHNSGPLVFDVTPTLARVRTAKFSALETDLTLGGSYAFGSPSPWNLNLQGAANLAVLGSFYHDLVATGTAKVDATIRGAATDPQMGGRMSVTGASFYLKDLPNGVEQASGTIYFEKNRANIEKITGQTGGGSFEISGFAGWSGSELSYRLKATASNIRVRYPEGVSTALDSEMTLTGSPSRSLLAGSLTVRRAGISGGQRPGQRRGHVREPDSRRRGAEPVSAQPAV